MISERTRRQLEFARGVKRRPISTNQRLSYEGISVYHWFVRSRENFMSRAKSIFGTQKPQNGAKLGLRPCEEIQRILVSKIPVYYSAILF